MPPSVVPQIIAGYGSHEHDYKPPRIERKGLYRNLSTVMCVPTRGMVPVRVVDSWLSMITPPNQPFVRLFGAGMEVGEAYNQLVLMVLQNPMLERFRYLLMVEEDNLMEPMSFIDLVAAADRGNFDVLGGLYFLKQEMQVAQIWGDPKDPIENYRNLDPVPGKIVRCNGTGMGFTLFKLDLFRQFDGPWFETKADASGVWTQDLQFFSKARKAGLKLKVGVDCRVKIAHFDFETGILW